jgi:hypothetical protein
MKRILLLIIVVFSANSTLVFAQSVPSYVPTSGLVGWWPFNGNANDESGNGNNGTVHSAVLTTNRLDQTSSAYFFGGSNQQIRCPNHTLLTSQKELSAAAWFFVQNRPSGWEQNVILSNIGEWRNSGGFEIYTGNPPGTSLGGMFRNSTYYDQAFDITGTNINANQWYHIVYTLQYITASNTTKATLYLNGAYNNQHTFSGNIVYNNITPFIIGVNVDSIGYQRAFKGKIDDVGLWNRPLTPSEISILYNATVTGKNLKENATGVIIGSIINSRYLQVVFSQNYTNSNYSIIDITGKTVQNGKLKSGISAIDIINLKKGIYIFKVESNENFVYKFIHQ